MVNQGFLPPGFLT